MGKYLMKGVMVLGLPLPEAVLREQLIKAAAGRVLIITGALGWWNWLLGREWRVEWSQLP